MKSTKPNAEQIAQSALAAMLADVAPKNVDQSAFTRAEIQEASGLGKSLVCERIRRNVTSGIWEQVVKKVGIKFLPAYRKKK